MTKLPQLMDRAITVTEVIKTAPPRIWLQVGTKAHYQNEAFPQDTQDVTWCAESVTSCEVPYIRADLVFPRR